MNSQNQHPLQLALEELKTMPTIDIDGKSYTTVANRISILCSFSIVFNLSIIVGFIS